MKPADTKGMNRRTFIKAGMAGTAAALIAAGHWRFGEGEDPTRPRTAFCMMGVCQQCLLRVDGRLVQACLTPVVAGQQVTAA